MLKKIILKIIDRVKDLFFGVFWYTRDFVVYKYLSEKQGIKEKFLFFPRILDKNPNSHTFDKHYVYMDRWAFKCLIKNKPVEHIDVGSSIRFLSMASAMVPVNFIDIRPVKLDFDNFKCTQGSILEMPFVDNSVDSLSCLHVAEHIGLGRYGDILDPLGTLKSCKELGRILKPGGRLYFALPIGKNAIYFNAHRVHDPSLILKYFESLKLEAFHVVDDKGTFISNAILDKYKNSKYACGMFEFTKT